MLKIFTMGLMFRLLEDFAVERNRFAPIIYKTLTFSLIENHDDLDIRFFLISNFSSTFQNLNTIPIGILVEPLIK